MKRNVIARIVACALALMVTATGFTPVSVQAAGQAETEAVEDTETVEEVQTEAVTETESVTEAVAEDNTAEAANETEVAAEDEAEEETEVTEVTADEPEAVQAANSFENRQCGSNVYATLSKGTLTLSGSGDMYEGCGSKTQPNSTGIFADAKNTIYAVVVKKGVTSIGNYAFAGCTSLNQITMEDASVITIGQYAFYGTAIRAFKAPSSLKTIGYSAFQNCGSLANVSLNDDLEEIIGDLTFWSTALREVEIPEYCNFSYTAFLSGYQGGNIAVHQKTTVTLNANGGTVDGVSQKEIIQYKYDVYGKPAKLPTPVRSGYDFLGWYDCTDYGVETAITGQNVRAHAILRAKWCNHASKVVKGKKTATYEKDGYTGDTYCKKCSKRLSLGHTIDRKILKTPKISSVENVSSGLKVKWLKTKDAKGYYVYKNVSGKYKKIATIKKGTTTSYTDKSVKNSTGKSYSYKVCAYYGKATSDFSGVRTQTRVASAAIGNVKNTAKKTLNVNWKKVTKCKGYQIQYTQDKNFKKKVTTKSAKKQSQDSMKLTKLTKGKKYYVRVRSYTTYRGKTYYSAWSSVKSTTVKK